MGASGISYLDYVWSPVVGCTPASEGCKHCWASQLHGQRHKAHAEGKNVPAQYAKPFSEVQCIASRLDDPLHWKKPRRIGVCFTGDLFHDDVPSEFIAAVFGVMAACPQHTFVVLTKRAKRMRKWFRWVDCDDVPSPQACVQWCAEDLTRLTPSEITSAINAAWPLPNVWLGVTAENQQRADERIPLLLECPAAVRWVSVEPMVGPVNLRRMLGAMTFSPLDIRPDAKPDDLLPVKHGLHWVVVGGESGPKARACDVEWIRGVVRQCEAADVSVYVKQVGSMAIDRNDRGCIDDDPTTWPEDTGFDDIEVLHHQGAPVRVRLHDRSGANPDEWPSDLRVRQYPRR